MRCVPASNGGPMEGEGIAALRVAEAAPRHHLGGSARHRQDIVLAFVAAGNGAHPLKDFHHEYPAMEGLGARFSSYLEKREFPGNPGNSKGQPTPNWPEHHQSAVRSCTGGNRRRNHGQWPERPVSCTCRVNPENILLSPIARMNMCSINGNA